MHDEVASMFVTYHCAYLFLGGGGGGGGGVCVILISGDKLCRTYAEMTFIKPQIMSGHILKVIVVNYIGCKTHKRYCYV